MSGRGVKRRGRPPKTPVSGRNQKFQYHLMKKPKYLLNRGGSDSQFSTPSASRASSPQNSEEGGRRSFTRPSTSRKRRGRGASTAATRGAHISQSGRRGYESEYHYGSDFGDSTDNDQDEEQLLMSPSDSESIDPVENDSDSDFSLSSYSNNSNANNAARRPRQPSPEPVWLRQVDIPPLDLPPTSDDLPIPHGMVLRVTSLYEVLRRFRNLVRLSPFRLEDFCAALACEDQSNLLVEIHVMLLKAIIREEDSQATHFGPLDQKDSVNISLYLMDSFTWPEVMRSYVESDSSAFDKDVLQILTEKEYPFCDFEDRLTVLQFLVDQFLITTPIRENLLQEGPIHYDDHCRICHRLGDLLCCETCPAVFHLECVDPPLVDVPQEDWQCSICKSHKVTGVVDCVSQQEKHGLLCRQDHLGFDRHGRKFWFVCRRIFVESEDGTEVWYYTTVAQFEKLISKLDENDLEELLCHEINENKEEILRQMTLTETLTNQYKGGKKSYLEVLNEQLEKVDGDGNDMELEDNVDSMDDNTEADKNTSTVSRLTRNRLQQISNGTLHFKLGMENAFKTYQNQFALNVNALNKPQRNEERDKKRHLSHKFSLTQASEFKWMSGSNTTKQGIVNALRATVLSLEQSIPTPFLHPNWQILRKVWIQKIATSDSAVDFVRILIALQACMKTVIFASVWVENLGHIKMYRITSNEREEKKKIEKREKREHADEEERNRLAFNFVKYSLGLKHQVWKQKGEEYRIHGQWSWMWLSTSRRQIRNKKPQSVIPSQKIVTKIIITGEDNALEKIISISPITYKLVVEGTEDPALEEAIAEIGQLEVVQPERSFDYLDISMALSTPGRILYPKVARRSKLDELLFRRIALKDAEIKKMQPNSSVAKDGGQDVDIENSDEIPRHTITPTSSSISNVATENDLLNIVGEGTKQAATSSTTYVHSGPNADLLNSLTKQIQTVRIMYGQLNKIAKNYRCYTKDCNPGPNLILKKASTCYSPLCMQKDRVRQQLLNLTRKAHSAGVSSKDVLNKPVGSILEQKLTNGKGVEGPQKSVEEERNAETEVPVDQDDIKSVVRDLKNGIDTGRDYDEDLFADCLLMKQDDIELEERELKKEDNAEEIKIEPKEEKAEAVSEKVENGLEQLTKDQSNDSAIGMDKTAETPRRGTRGRPPKAKNMNNGNGGSRQSSRFVESNLAYHQDLLAKSEKEFVPRKPNRRFPLAVGNKVVKKEDVKAETELGPDGSERVYSTKSRQGRVYLKKQFDDPVCNLKTKSVQNKFPVVGNFKTKRGTRSILVLPRHELMRIARAGGKITASGFNPQSKNNITVWPYPCQRPMFKTCWLYRLMNAKTLNSICLGLRVIWTCLRWDDMQTKSPTTDGKHQITTENEILNMEILKHRHVGKFMEQTQYLRRKVLIPLELPKAVREVTSIRSGLRKRKRAESPQHTEPQVSEEWVDEDKLELWEIKQYGERQDKGTILPVTRTSTGKLPPARQYEVLSSSNHPKTIIISGKATPEEIKEKLEQQLKLQRQALNQKRALENKQASLTQKSEDVSNSQGSSTGKQIIRQRNIICKNQDGTTKIVQQQIITKPEPQKVQIIRGPDGKVSVRGLNPGQQLIQDADGKIHVINTQQTTRSPVVKQLTTTGIKPIISRTATITGVMGQSAAKPPQLIIRPSPGQSTKSVVQKVIQQIPTTTTIIQKTPMGNKIIGTKTNSAPTLVSTSSPGGSQQKIVTTTNLQQLLAQNPGQKIILNPGAGQQRIFLANSSGQQQQLIVQQNPGQITQQPQQILINQPKVVQQIITSPTGATGQQQIVIGNQRFLLAPGQRIVTQGGQLHQQTATVTSPVKTIIQQQPVVQQVAANQVQYQIQTTQPVQQQQMQNPQQQQIVIQSNANLAQQLASGKLQMLNLNGQQVIVRPVSNSHAQIVAHVKQQENGPAQIVTTAQQQVNTRVVGDKLELVQSAQEVVTNAPEQQPQAAPVVHNMPDDVTKTMLQGQPPGTIIKAVTAQVTHSPDGPRIVLSGLSGTDLNPQQMAIVQQQIKQQLLKAQEGKPGGAPLGPTKIYVAVQPAQPPPLAMVSKGDQHQTTSSPLQSGQAAENSVTDLDGTKMQGAITGINEDVKKGLIQKMLAKSGGRIVVGAGSQIGQIVKLEDQSIDAQSTVKRVIMGKGSESKIEDGSGDADDGSFKVTPDYIQQTIRNALKQDNLNPEIEEKLLNLQRYQERQMKGGDMSSFALYESSDFVEKPYSNSAPSSARKRNTARRDYDDEDVDEEDLEEDAGGIEDEDDDDWYTQKKRRPKASTSKSDRKSTQNLSPFMRNRMEGGGGLLPGEPIQSAVVHQQLVSRPEATVVKLIQPRPVPIPVKTEAADQKKKAIQIQVILNKQKEQLMKDMLRKRLALESQLQQEVSQEIKSQLVAVKGADAVKSEDVAKSFNKITEKEQVRKRSSSGTASVKKESLEGGSATSTSPNKTLMTNSPNKSNRSTKKLTKSPSESRAISSGSSGSKKKEKIFCICRTPYDNTKFYVGCDMCNNWFHGDCVGITSEASLNMEEFICSECQHARETQELYCLCKQPYDESQFYICCDKCQDWFHGRCVGILQREAENIDEYICPNCTKSDSVSAVNMKSLSDLEFDHLKKLMKLIMSHKSAWPFVEPVDPQEAPDYYKVIKEPMDLLRVESRINNKEFTTLSQFIGDMTKIFDNCRYYNPKESQFYRCAESLEAFFLQKIKQFRETMSEHNS